MNAFIKNINFKTVESQALANVNDFHNNNFAFTKNTNLKIYHLIIRSISKNFDDLKILLKQLCCSFDCIVLTEIFNIAQTTFFRYRGLYDYLQQWQNNQR